MRRTTPAVLVSALSAAVLTGCGGGGAEPQAQRSSAPSCPGGQVRFLQGQPADLPGGGTGGIGEVRRTDPPTVNLSLGGRDVEARNGLGVGDTFGVEGTTYQITCISPGTVTAEEVD